MKKYILGFVLALSAFGQLRADEGMWPLVMLQKIQDPMQAKGLKLSAEQIYSINNSSVKDGVVRLMQKSGRMFCTGEIISDKGLFLTNHHCGYDAIQELSSPADNILTNGFWAKNMNEERPANFNIGLLRKIEDVTAKILEGTSINEIDSTRSITITKNYQKLVAELKAALGEDAKNYSIEITPFYNGNQYLAMFYEVFRDIRLVGTPPENVGKFGGETDNWRWPRHTADFSMFRIYAGADNKPADYNAANTNYKPLHHFPISLKGANKGDFSMILGYPGTTTRYTYSEGIKYLSSKERPMRVQLRREIMDVYEVHMKVDKNIRLMYSDRLARLGNYWNKFKGEAADLSKPGIYEKRKAEELAFEKWTRDNNKTAQYGEATALYDEVYRKLNQYGLYPVYLQDGISNSQPMSFALSLRGLAKTLADKTKAADAKTQAADMAKGLDEMFKEFNNSIEKKVLTVVLRRIYEDLDPANLPKSLTNLVVKYKRDYDKLADFLWKTSFLTDKAKFAKFLAKPNLSVLKKDPIFAIVDGYSNKINVELEKEYKDINKKLARAGRLFVAGTLEMSPDKIWSPDANGTMRLTYGSILDYKPRDGQFNYHFTTAQGIVEKYIPGDFEFDAPKALIDLIKNKDYGQYADADGELHACFLSDNDITGGNSGSPVINGNGELIGTAFDGNYEAISSDFMFMPDVQRTISVDIRYTLFIVDKLGGAKNIIDELTLVK